MRIEALTFYRFLAAIMVVVHHFGNNLVSRDFAFQMVTFFFVLSGFVLTVAYYPKAEFSTKSYAINRIFRIAPVYLIALALAIGPNSKATAIILNLTFLQSWFPPYPLSVNFPAWSLSVEMFFYLSFPFILANLKKTSPTQFMMIAGIVWGFTQMVIMNLLNSPFYAGFPSVSHDLIYFFPISHLNSFLLGMGAASMFLKNKVRWKIPTLYSLPLIASLFALIIFGYKFEQMISFLMGHDWKFGGSFYAPVFMALILTTALSDNLFTKILSLKLPVLLGEASYALYILQFPMYKIFYNWIRPLFPFGGLDLIVYLAFLTMASIISFYCLEKPVKRLGQNLVNRT